VLEERVLLARVASFGTMVPVACLFSVRPLGSVDSVGVPIVEQVSCGGLAATSTKVTCVLAPPAIRPLTTAHPFLDTELAHGVRGGPGSPALEASVAVSIAQMRPSIDQLSSLHEGSEPG